MLFSTVGYAFMDRDQTSEYNSIEYNGETYSKSGDYWIWKYDGKTLATEYNPSQTKDILVLSSLTLSDFQDKPLYISGENYGAEYEIARNLAQFSTRVQEVCITENCSRDLPIKDCSEDNVIVIQDSKVESVYQIENCVYIDASIENQTKYADAFLFKLFEKV
jgi:hypothetical protein